MKLIYLFWILCSLYLAGWLLCCLSFIRYQKNLHNLGELSLLLGLIVQLVYIGASFFTPDFFPFYTIAGLLLFLSLLVILIYFILDYLYRKDIFEVIFPPLTVFFLMLSSSVSISFMLTPNNNPIVKNKNPDDTTR